MLQVGSCIICYELGTTGGAYSERRYLDYTLYRGTFNKVVLIATVKKLKN